MMAEAPAMSPEAKAYAARAERLGAAAPHPQASIGYGPNEAQRIDLYLPDDATRAPILLFLHGGAWVSGHPGWVRFMAPALRARRIILAAAGYRLAPTHRWPAQRDDIAAALSALAKAASTFGGDATRIAVGGHSAGGHLASLLALGPDGGAIRACLPVSAPFDLRYGDVPLESDAGRVYRYLLADRAQDSDASPITHVHAKAPPFHLLWGEQDFNRVRESGGRMAEALGEAGVPTDATILASATHFDTHLALRNVASPWYARLADALQAREEAAA